MLSFTFPQKGIEKEIRKKNIIDNVFMQVSAEKDTRKVVSFSPFSTRNHFYTEMRVKPLDECKVEPQ